MKLAQQAMLDVRKETKSGEPPEYAEPSKSSREKPLDNTYDVLTRK
eukprot:gene262-3637_t